MGLTGSDSPSTREQTSGSLSKARLFQAYADSSSLECIAMKAITVMQILLLQNVIHLQRQMKLWLDGDIQALLDEGKFIQKRLGRATSPSNNDAITRIFRDLMLQGKVQSAYLSRNTNGVCSN